MAAPEVFELAADNLVSLLTSAVDEDGSPDVIEARDLCPARAISVRPDGEDRP